MVATALAAEVTGAVRELGADIDTHGRALGTSVPVHLLAWLANAVGASASRDWAIVDKSLTRC